VRRPLLNAKEKLPLEFVRRVLRRLAVRLALVLAVARLVLLRLQRFAEARRRQEAFAVRRDLDQALVRRAVRRVVLRVALAFGRRAFTRRRALVFVRRLDVLEGMLRFLAAAGDLGITWLRTRRTGTPRSMPCGGAAA